jgi:hypothetical protein
MEPPQQNAPMTATLPPASRLVLFALLLPAFVAGANHLLINTLSGDSSRIWLFPALIASTAAISWCAGRYLYPFWFRSILFAWCLVLLDALVTLACMTHRIDDQFGYVLVSAQISLLVLWGVLGAQPWQWRLPVIAALSPLAIMFSGVFTTASVYGGRSEMRAWNAMMFITAAIIAVLCGGLRYVGFTLKDASRSYGDSILQERPTYQFGMKHMLIWFSVSGPLLLLVRSLDIQGTIAFPVVLLAVTIATVNLLAIWAVLGSGYWLVRVAALIGIPFLIAYGMSHYSAYILAANTITRRNAMGLTWITWKASYYGSMKWVIGEMHDHWIAWLWIDAALLAALLLFFRASGYRLTRSAR